MNAAKVVVHEVKGNVAFVVLTFFEKAIGQASNRPVPIHIMRS
jgi:hypothetical protein